MSYEIPDIASIIDEEATKLGVSPAFVRRIIFQGENFGNSTVTDATSPKGARGVAQVMPATWAGLLKQGKLSADDDPHDPRASIRAGIQVLKEGLDSSGGNEKAAAANYNGGAAALRAVLAGKEPPAEETRQYLARVFDDNALDFSTPAGKETTPTGKASLMVSDLSESFKKTLADNAALIMRLRGHTGDQVAALSNAASAVTGRGDAEATMATTTGAIDVARQEQGRRILDSAKGGIDSLESRWRANTQKKEEAELVMDRLKPTIDAEDQVMLWDDPLRWIANQFTQPSLKIAYNAANASRAQAVRRIVEDQAMIDAQKKIDPAITTQLTTEHFAAMAAAKKLGALEEASKLQATSAHALAQSTLTELQQSNLGYAGQKELVHLSLSAMGHEKQELADKRAEEVLQMINLKQVAMGLPPYKAVEFEMLPAAQKSQLIEAARYPSIGKDPGSTLAIIAGTGQGRVIGSKMPAVEEFYSKQMLSEPFKQELRAIELNHPKLSPVEQRAMAMSAVAMKQANALIDNKEKNSLLPDTNPYKLKLLNNIQQPELADNPFTQTVKDVAAMSPDKTTVTDKDIFAAAVAKVKADPKQISVIAKQLSEFYTKGIELQWARTGPSMVGYAKPRGYGVSGDSIGMNTERAIQMASPAEVELFLMRQLSLQQAMTQGLKNLNDMGYAPHWSEE